MHPIFFIVAGGGLGALARWWIYENAKKWLSIMPDVPLGTFIANIIGSLFLGYLAGRWLYGHLSSSLWFFFATGFCGGLTTFSTFILEIYQLHQKFSAATALMYVSASIITGFVFLWLGMKLAASFTSLP